MSAHLSTAPRAENLLEDFDSAAEAEQQSGIFRLTNVELPRAASAPLDHDFYERFGPVVRRIALKTMRSLPRTHVLDDLISAGWIGMTEAHHRRPPDMEEEQFEAYASCRIRGAILDYLRTLDPLSRRLRSFARQIQAATRELSQKLGRLPEQEEVAARLGVGLAELQRVMVEIREAGVDPVDVSESLDAAFMGPSPESAASHNQTMRTVTEHSEALPERLRLVLTLHYLHERSLREIGEILGVTESRVCQLHAEAIQKIRARVEAGRP
jgi:RNA polymerase sigma factor for flagellar operon FliA